MSDNETNSDKITIKLALILCDTPVPAVVASRGTYLEIFRDQLRLSFPNDLNSHSTTGEHPLPFTLDGFDVVNKQEYPDLDGGRYRAILISGSRFNAYDNDPWIIRLVDWVREVAENKPDVKLIGICFGHQIIARALGGRCVPNDRWEVGTTEIELTDVGKKVFRTDERTLPIQQMHRDHVPSLPPSFHLLASTRASPVQGFVRFHPSSSPAPTKDVNPKDIQIFTVQGHPEFTADICNAIIDAREKLGVFTPKEAQDGRERAVRPHEGTGSIGRTIWRVLGVKCEEPA